MQLTRDNNPDANIITGLSGDSLRVRDRVYTGSLLLSADALHADWPVRSVDDLTEASWAPLVAMRAEIVLLGTGDQLVFPDGRVLAPLARLKIGVEVMDTAAACRTYNVLLSEGRAVAAALILGGGSGAGVGA